MWVICPWSGQLRVEGFWFRQDTRRRPTQVAPPSHPDSSGIPPPAPLLCVRWRAACREAAALRGSSVGGRGRPRKDPQAGRQAARGEAARAGGWMLSEGVPASSPVPAPALACVPLLTCLTWAGKAPHPGSVDWGLPRPLPSALLGPYGHGSGSGADWQALAF